MTPVIVGLAGGTACGKTTAAARLERALGDRIVRITHDRYYKGLPEGVDPMDHNFDHPDSLQTDLLIEHIAALKRGERVHVPEYEFSRHRRAETTKWTWVEPAPIVLVEGILVLADPGLCELFDHKVFVYTPDDIRLIRRITRDRAERGRHTDEILAYYLRTVRPMHEQFVAPSQARASLVLDGTQSPDELVAQLIDLL